jgi:tetratricopeptide (TPR) repeat protein
LEKILKMRSYIIILFLLISSSSFSKNFITVGSQQQDSMQLIAQYSLFSEYYKNKDYVSALPYGWKVLEIDPVKFNKWIYYKMEDALWKIHDSSGVSQDLKKEAEDSIVTFYDLAIKYYPVDKGYFEVRKAYVEQKWLSVSPDTVILIYEQAFKDNPELPTYYYDLLGILYKDNMSSDNDYQTKDIDLYNKLIDREPNNDVWLDKLKELAKDPEQLLIILKQAWDRDKDNLAKAWTYASMAIRESKYEDAAATLEFLTQKSPETVNYWNQLATAYQKTNQLKKAEDAYKKLIQLEPDNKNHYMNLGIVYKDEGQLSAARVQYEKASKVGSGWGLPIFYEGLLYEQAARDCGTFDFNAKVVYQLAVDTYKKAGSMDNSATQAQERISALKGSVPTQEDYFFRGYKSGQTIPITGDCYGWIERSITVP